MANFEETVEKAVVIELPLPYQNNGLLQRMRNDIIVNKAMDGKYRHYIFKILSDDPTIPTACLFAYVSELYSKSWNEAVLRSQFDANIIVTSDQLATSTINDKYQIAKIYSPTGKTEITTSSSEVEFVDYSTILASFEASLQRWKVVVLDDYPSTTDNHPSYEYVAVGGSFDQLHNGHKKLLFSSLSVCQTELTVGITADFMLAAKAMAEAVQKFPQRFENVRSFLTLFKPTLQYNIVEIIDPFGPTITDARLQAIVASSETINGAFKINEIRETKSMKPLDILIIGRSDSAILSSTFLRKQRIIEEQSGEK